MNDTRMERIATVNGAAIIAPEPVSCRQTARNMDRQTSYLSENPYEFWESEYGDVTNWQWLEMERRRYLRAGRHAEVRWCGKRRALFAEKL